MNAFTTANTTSQKTVSNGIRHGGIHKRRSPRRSSLNKKEVNFAYVDSQILQRPKTVKQTTPLHEEYDPSACLYSEFELDAYASNEGLFQKLGFVSSTA